MRGGATFPLVGARKGASVGVRVALLMKGPREEEGGLKALLGYWAGFCGALHMFPPQQHMLPDMMCRWCVCC